MAQVSRIRVFRALVFRALGCVLCVGCGAHPPEPAARAFENTTQAPKMARPVQELSREEQQWLQTHVPQLSNFEPVEEGLIDKLRSWIPRGTRGTLFSPRCEPMTSESGRLLVGTLHRPERIEHGVPLGIPPNPLKLGDRKTVHSDKLHLGAQATFYCGSEQVYERGSNKKWKLVQQAISGCMDIVGAKLAKVTDDAVWYVDEGTLVNLRLACEPREHHYEERCQDGTVRTCTTCSRWTLTTANQGSVFASGAPQASQSPSFDGDCSKPCQSGVGAIELEHFANFLGGTFIELRTLRHPLVFRTRDACLAYQKSQRPSQADMGILDERP